MFINKFVCKTTELKNYFMCVNISVFSARYFYSTKIYTAKYSQNKGMMKLTPDLLWAFWGRWLCPKP